VVQRISEILDRDRDNVRANSEKTRQRLQQQLAVIRERIDKAYADELDGKIPEEFWQRKMSEWQEEERRIEAAETGLTSSPTENRSLRKGV
jgi:hypothetical protein